MKIIVALVSIASVRFHYCNLLSPKEKVVTICVFLITNLCVHMHKFLDYQFTIGFVPLPYHQKKKKEMLYGVIF